VITGLLLAAGSGTRFGGGKLLASLPAASHGVAAGTPIGVAACFHLAAALPRVVALVRPRDAALREHLRATGVEVVECARAHEGMGATLACGVEVTADASGWIVALADMPWIAPATIEAIAARLRQGASIVAPMHAGQRGHPGGFAAPWFSELAALAGDEGARSVIARHAAAVQTIEVDDPGVLRDVDLRRDLGAP
jgi:molybdenum cofactor cytidylyltransferase